MVVCGSRRVCPGLGLGLCLLLRKYSGVSYILHTYRNAAPKACLYGDVEYTLHNTENRTTNTYYPIKNTTHFEAELGVTGRI